MRRGCIGLIAVMCGLGVCTAVPMPPYGLVARIRAANAGGGGGGGACDQEGLSETATSYDLNVANESSRAWWAVEVVVGAGEGHTVCKVEQVYDVVGSPDIEITAYIYSDSSGEPGSSLATSTSALDSTLYSGADQTLSWDFSGYALSSGTTYWLVMRVTDGGVNGANYLRLKTGAVSGNGTDTSTDGTTWTDTSSRQGNYITYHN